MNNPIVEIFPGNQGFWFWHLQAPNAEIIAACPPESTFDTAGQCKDHFIVMRQEMIRDNFLVTYFKDHIGEQRWKCDIRRDGKLFPYRSTEGFKTRAACQYNVTAIREYIAAAEIVIQNKPRS